MFTCSALKVGKLVGNEMTVYNDLKRILAINKDTTKLVVIYAFAIALLSLIIPISVQSLVNVVSFGTLIQPIVVLTIILFTILSIIAGLRIAQAVVVETIQQNVFATLNIDVVKYIPRLKIKCFAENRILTDINLFFEIQTVQKSLAVLLTTMIEIFFVGLFSMILIAFYHPLLLMFDIILVVSLIFVLIWPWKSGVKFALKECDAKHSVAEWLEEVAINTLLFKFSNRADEALKVVDSKIITYLQARKMHFKAILKHLISMNIVYVLANSALLGIGGYLVIKEQISLGQLVASELLVNALLYGFLRFSYYLDDIYDLIASSTKLSRLIDMEKESKLVEHKAATHANPYEGGITLLVKNLVVEQPLESEGCKPLSFSVSPGGVLAIYKAQGYLASAILDTLVGLRDNFKGAILINDLPIKDAYFQQLYANTLVLRRSEFFQGSLRENILIGSNTISQELIYKYFVRYHLAESLHQLPEGLESDMQVVKSTFSDYDILKLSYIRAMIHQPRLLLIDYYLDYFFNGDLLNAIQDLDTYTGTVILTTRREKILKHYTNQIVL